MKKPTSFEAAMLRLEEIANALENGNAELAASLKLYEEGAGLAAWCTSELANASRRVTELSVEKLNAAGDESNDD